MKHSQPNKIIVRDFVTKTTPHASEIGAKLRN
jgi:hypothetical protein